MTDIGDPAIWRAVRRNPFTVADGHTALYVRTPRLLAELALSRGDGRYVRRLGQLARIGLLVLDDFLRAPRGAVIPRGLRDPPLAAAPVGRS
jgi:IstB-like ATP binding protein